MANNKGKSQYEHVSNCRGLNLTLTLGSPKEHKPKLEESKNVGGIARGLCDSFRMNDQTSYDKRKGNFPLKIGQVNELGDSSSAPGRVATNATLFRPLATRIGYGTGSNPSSFYEKLMSNKAFAVPFYNELTAGYAKSCQFCGVKSTPLWRKGPNGPQTLCNACGLKYTRNMKKDAE